MMTAPLLTVSQTAKLLQLEQHAVLALIHRGQIVASNVSSGKKRPRWRIERHAIDAFLAERRSGPIVRQIRSRRAPMIEYV